MKTLIRNGYLLDPANGREGRWDLLIEDRFIRKVEKDLSAMERDGIPCIDAEGNYVVPGFVDLHVHLREPGFEYKETVRTGTRAAARGGYTSIFCMPNTKPVLDSASMVGKLMGIITKDALVNVYPVGSVTLGQMGERETDVSAMKDAGVMAISEDGRSVMNASVYRRAMRKAREAGIPVFAHCEDADLAEGGVMNAGDRAVALGLMGISNSVEDVITARDVFLAKETGARLHLCHCSTKDSVELVRMAKMWEIPVTAEVCPHHFTLSDEDITVDDGNYKMNPPLRSAGDVKALKDALRDGVMEVIATDHAPHSEEEKRKSITDAMFGIVGLETAFALSVTELVEGGWLTPMQLIERMSSAPARVGNIRAGSLGEGMPADIVICNMDEWYEIDAGQFASKGSNTPFHGRRVKGRVLKTMVSGNIVYGWNGE